MVALGYSEFFSFTPILSLTGSSWPVPFLLVEFWRFGFCAALSSCFLAHGAGVLFRTSRSIAASSMLYLSSWFHFTPCLVGMRTLSFRGVLGTLILAAAGSARLGSL